MLRGLVTGVPGALGTAVARALVAAGYETSVIVRKEEEAPLAPDGAQVYVADLLDLVGLRTLASHTGPLNAICACAGGFGMGDLDAVTDEDVERMIDINFRTAQNTLSAFGPHLTGAAVLVGSQASPGSPHMAAYAASKAAVASLVRSADLEWRGSGRRVVGVQPDTIDTPANRAAMPNADFDRWAKPDEIANVMIFLCSDAGRLVHGTMIPVGR